MSDMMRASERGSPLIPTEERTPNMPDDETIVEESDQLLSAKEVARMLGTDPRTFRKFMRSITEADEQPGQGGRYAIDPEDVPALQKQFKKWGKGASKNGAKGKGKKVKIQDAIELDDEVVDLDEENDLADDTIVELDEIEVIED
jgi:hypothetical protein